MTKLYIITEMVIIDGDEKDKDKEKDGEGGCL